MKTQKEMRRYKLEFAEALAKLFRDMGIGAAVAAERTGVSLEEMDLWLQGYLPEAEDVSLFLRFCRLLRLPEHPWLELAEMNRLQRSPMEVLLFKLCRLAVDNPDYVIEVPELYDSELLNLTYVRADSLLIDIQRRLDRRELRRRDLPDA